MKQCSSKKIKVIAIVGATASGKTAYSIELAKKIDGEIISADSRLVYKGMDIGTAKPTSDEQCGIPHYMIDIVEPEFEYSVGLYQKQAKEKIYEIASRGKTPIVVGGTGLYTDILLKNFSLPSIPPNWDKRNELNNYSSEELFEILSKKDPKAAQEIKSADKKKIIRALEIIEITGQTLDKVRGIKAAEFDVQWIGRNFDREILYERIEQRVDKMIENGLIEETKKLIKQHGKIHNIVNTIGYKEILSYLDKECSIDEAVKKLKQNTRNYAKRQLTWFRKNPEIEWNIYPQKLKK
ncbi:tRNA (adenosine(37)-N6)-dimethylallyltransferase MiaA [bacterium]|nr:tRNA (adenosine(37)-N6)-dimethylallyltransferase MiaA [bacterium]